MEDHVSIGSLFAKRVIARYLKKLIAKSLNRKADIDIYKLELSHKQGGEIGVVAEVGLSMTEAELEALIESIS